MGMPQPVARFDESTFLAWEAERAQRHELVGGEVYSMAVAGDAHKRLAGNGYVAMRNALRGTPCRTFMSDVKLHVAAAEAFFYPGVFVTCDERDFGAGADRMKRRPRVIVEVLKGARATASSRG